MRVLEERWEVTRVGNPPRSRSRRSTRAGPTGPSPAAGRSQRGDSGRLEATETFRFDSAELRNPLRNAVLKSGWTWRGVVFGKL